MRIELPLPPSVNSFRTQLGNQSPVVKKWVRHADGILLTTAPYPRFAGEVEVAIVWDAGGFGRFDIDNRCKALLDWLQRCRIIENDKLVRRLILEWGDAPMGCVVSVCGWQE